MLDVDAQVRRSDFALAARFTAQPGEIVAVAGPNGAGKSTLLRAIAGLLPLHSGRIVIAGQLVDSPADDLFVPAPKRPVGLMFQEYRLFPHLSAVANVAYGLGAAGVPRQLRLRQARQWLDRFGLADLADRLPAELSGGQAQRIALCRAMITAPAVLLLDEPFAALDVEVRAKARRILADHLEDFAGVTLLVTHDRADIEALASRTLVLDHGTVTSV